MGGDEWGGGVRKTQKEAKPTDSDCFVLQNSKTFNFNSIYVD